MGIGVGIFLVAIGAILAFAVNVTTSAVNLETVGVILMLVGGTGVLLSLIYWNSWGGLSGGSRHTEITESDQDMAYSGPGRRVVRQEHVHRF
jgi:hypothetical protein